jgi:hypothetical protein
MLNLQSCIVVCTNRASKLIHTNMRLQKLKQLSPTCFWARDTGASPSTYGWYLPIDHPLTFLECKPVSCSLARSMENAVRFKHNDILDPLFNNRDSPIIATGVPLALAGIIGWEKKLPEWQNQTQVGSGFFNPGQFGPSSIDWADKSAEIGPKK